MFAVDLTGGSCRLLDKRFFPASDLLRVKPLASAVFTQFDLAQRGGLDDDGQFILVAQLATGPARTGRGALFVTILAPPGIKCILGNPRLPDQVGHTDVLRRQHPGDHAFFELFRILGTHNFRRSPLPPSLTQSLLARGDIYPDMGGITLAAFAVTVEHRPMENVR